MELMVSHNIVHRKKYPKLYEDVDIVRINSPWYTKKELIDAITNTDKIRFMDINIKKRKKAKKVEHDYRELLKLIGTHDVEWVGISNVEDECVYDEVRCLLENDTTKICAKIETEMGCWHADYIISAFDGIMVDTEDLAFEIGWKRASEEKDRIYDLCKKKGKKHFRLMGTIFEGIE